MFNTTAHSFKRSVPCSVDLVLGFPESKIIPYWVAQVPSLESSSPTVYDDDDVLECAYEIVMPVSFVLNIDLLALWPTVPENTYISAFSFKKGIAQTRRIILGTSSALSHPCEEGAFPLH
jgi:hypothetical protein